MKTVRILFALFTTLTILTACTSDTSTTEGGETSLTKTTPTKTYSLSDVTKKKLKKTKKRLSSQNLSTYLTTKSVICLMQSLNLSNPSTTQCLIISTTLFPATQLVLYHMSDMQAPTH